MNNLYIKNGKFFSNPLVTDEYQIFNPTEEMLLEAGYVKYVPTTIELTPELKINEEIMELKDELARYDYIGVKIATGCATITEYAELIEHCLELRARINELLDLLN